MNKKQKQAVEELVYYAVMMTEGGEDWANEIRDEARVAYEMLIDDNVKSYVDNRVTQERTRAKNNGRRLLESAVPDFRKRLDAFAREQFLTWEQYVGKF